MLQSYICRINKVQIVEDTFSNIRCEMAACSDLKKKVQQLCAELKELCEKKENSIPKPACEMVETLSKGVN